MVQGSSQRFYDLWQSDLFGAHRFSVDWNGANLNFPLSERGSGEKIFSAGHDRVEKKTFGAGPDQSGA